MFKSLPARLILSYVVVIVICLTLVGLAALLLLRGYQRDLTFRRLADRSGLVAQLLVTSARREATPQQTIERLAEQMNQGDGPVMFVYLLDAEGFVIAGSDGGLDGQRFEWLAVRPTPPAPEAMRGERRLATGERLLYVAELVRLPAGEGGRNPDYVLVLGQVFQPVRFALGDLLPRLAWAGMLALALSVGVAALMAYSIARPLDRIALAAEKVAGGDYDQQLEIAAPTEVARLATSFNSMARQVKATLQSQQDLVANVSHELKTPLTSIQGFSQALLDGTAGDAETRDRAAAVIHEEAGRMRRLVEELLDLARLEGGQVTLAREPVDLGEVMWCTADRFSPQSEQNDTILEVDVPPGLPPVVGDADRLGQVFGNLVDNALKHARVGADGGRVVLRVEERDRMVVCSVTDNGPGISAEALSRVFERFYQVDKSRAQRGGGAGLGLAIAQEIVQAHGGRIRAESVEGLGTRFTVELPAADGTLPGPGEVKVR
jgi:two-component system OmpR family sensor kinase